MKQKMGVCTITLVTKQIDGLRKIEQGGKALSQERYVDKKPVFHPHSQQQQTVRVPNT